MTSDAARHDGIRAAAVVAAAVAQVVGSPLGSAIADRSVGAVSDETGSLITPAGYAFSIWGVIFAGALAWAVYQALPAQRGRELHRRTGWPLAAAFAGNAAWEIAFPLIGVSVPLVPLVLLFCIVAATAVAWARLQDLPVEGLGRVLPAAVAGPFALAVVWGLVAVAVDGPPSPVVIAALAAASVVAVALVVRTVVRRDPVTLLVG